MSNLFFCYASINKGIWISTRLVGKLIIQVKLVSTKPQPRLINIKWAHNTTYTTTARFNSQNSGFLPGSILTKTVQHHNVCALVKRVVMSKHHHHKKVKKKKSNKIRRTIKHRKVTEYCSSSSRKHSKTKRGEESEVKRKVSSRTKHKKGKRSKGVTDRTSASHEMRKGSNHRRNAKMHRKTFSYTSSIQEKLRTDVQNKQECNSVCDKKREITITKCMSSTHASANDDTKVVDVLSVSQSDSTHTQQIEQDHTAQEIAEVCTATVEMTVLSENRAPNKHQQSQLLRRIHQIKSIVRDSRIWEETNYSRWFRKYGYHTKGCHFSMMSYNALAQNLLEDNYYLYNHCDESVLDWEYRKSNLLKEIKDHRPDIICLQEVEHSQFEEFWIESFKRYGYDGLYKKRHGDKQDGCAILYNKNALNLVKYVPVDYFKPNVRLMDRDNVAQVAVFHPIGLPESSTFCIANTHLLFNPKRGDIKVIQAMNLLAAIHHATHQLSCPVILCGDFNSRPHSFLYRLIVGGMLNYPGLTAGNISGQEEAYYSRGMLDLGLISPDMNLTESCVYENPDKERASSQPSLGTNPDVEQVIESLVQGVASRNKPLCNEPLPRTGVIHHGFPFMSVYDHSVSRERGYAEVSTHHSRGCCTLDYMFFTVASKTSHLLPTGEVAHTNVTEGKLHVMRRYRLMSDREVINCGGLPNAHQSSDHIPLLAHFFLEQ